MHGRGRAGRRVRARERERQAQGLLEARRSSSGIDQDARPSGVTNSGGPPIRVATTVRPQAIASSSACPNGSTRLGPQTTRASAISAGTSSCGTVGQDADPGRPSSRARSGPSPANVSVPSPSRSNAAASRARSSAASASRCRGTPAGSAGAGATGTARDRRRSRRPPSSRAPPAASPRARGADTRRPRRPRRRAARRAACARRRPGTEPMLRTSWPCAVTTSGARGCERREQARPGRGNARRRRRRRPRAQRAPTELEVAELAAGARVEHGAVDVVAPRRRSACSTCATNAPRSGRVGPRVHLRDEQDPHGPDTFRRTGPCGPRPPRLSRGREDRGEVVYGCVARTERLQPAACSIVARIDVVSCSVWSTANALAIPGR